LTTIAVIEKDALIASADAVGRLIREGLAQALAGVNGVVDIRGQGLMIGIELDRPCGELVMRGLDAGLLINVTADKVVRLLPPLILSADEGRELVSRLSPLIRDFLAA
jgi:acetylornithine aminotransferase